MAVSKLRCCHIFLFHPRNMCAVAIPVGMLQSRYDMRRNVGRSSTKKSVGVRDMFSGGRRCCRAVVEPSSAGGAGRLG
jgi:hypothetical protein